MNREWVFLQSVVTPDEYTLIENILAQEGIPVLKKSPGAGAYIEVVMGSILVGTGHKLYVPAPDLGRAQDILMNMEAEINPAHETDNDDYEETGSGFIMKHKDLFKKILIIFLLIIYGGGLIASIILQLINK